MIVTGVQPTGSRGVSAVQVATVDTKEAARAGSAEDHAPDGAAGAKAATLSRSCSRARASVSTSGRWRSVNSKLRSATAKTAAAATTTSTATDRARTVANLRD